MRPKYRIAILLLLAASGRAASIVVSFEFTLLGVPFHRSDIFQGGQALFLDGTLDNVTASFQVFLPRHSPVNNITFGFGGAGVIGYIDLNNQFGHGTFTINPVPEPWMAPIVLASLLSVLILLRSIWWRTRISAGRGREASG